MKRFFSLILVVAMLAVFVSGVCAQGEVIRRGLTGSRMIALTFDVEGDPGNCQRTLDVLAQNGIPATMFICGQEGKCLPSQSILGEVLAGGFELGNHGWSHSRWPQLSAEQLIAELEKTESLVANVGSGTTLPWKASVLGQEREHRYHCCFGRLHDRWLDNRSQHGVGCP